MRVESRARLTVVLASYGVALVCRAGWVDGGSAVASLLYVVCGSSLAAFLRDEPLPLRAEFTRERRV
jgi:hypothetical protein